MLSFRFAINGLKKLIRNEHNARVHLAAMIIVILAGYLFNVSSYEWLILTLCIGLVFITELLNTSIERISDFIEPNRNDKIGEIKDYAAGAVLIAALIAIICGAIIFIPKLISLING